MIIESLDEYLETVAGYIHDNDKLVTYKWLSKELEVHVNVAKQILWEFGQRHRKEGNLVTTFLLMGTLPDGGMRVEVVKDTDLSKAKEKYSKIISEHVYSLQKALPDIELLAISGDGDVKYSAIKCKESVERSEEEMHLLRWGTSMSAELQLDEKAKSLKESIRAESVQEHTKLEKNATVSNKGATAQQKGFNNLFGKAAHKQKSPTSASSNFENAKSPTKTSNGTMETSPKEAKSASPKKKVQRGGLDCFLEKNKTKTTNSQSPEEKQVKHDIIEENKNTKAPMSSNNNKQQKNTRGKKRNRSKENSDIAKKRKRITIQSDSSDSESCNEPEEEPEIPPSPEKISPVKARSPSPPRVKHEGGKRKVLKLVDKTFEEDGYLVTKKVHVYETCSEEEEEAEKEEVKKSESRAEPKTKKNTKQTTLMNFFKKS